MWRCTSNRRKRRIVFVKLSVTSSHLSIPAHPCEVSPLRDCLSNHELPDANAQAILGCDISLGDAYGDLTNYCIADNASANPIRVCSGNATSYVLVCGVTRMLTRKRCECRCRKGHNPFQGARYLSYAYDNACIAMI